MMAPALQSAVLGWSSRMLAARSLGALATEIAAPPALPGERLTGWLVLADPRHELRLLSTGEAEPAALADTFRFVDALAGLAPGLGALHAPWNGEYRAADHALLLDDRAGVTHLALLPLARAARLVGVYVVGARGAPPALAAAAAPVLEHVALQAAANADRLFCRARLLRAGAVDPFTGWNGLPYVQSRLREQVALSERRHEPATCMVIDVDGLGALNESGGVPAGDAALLEAGSRIEALVRASDTFAHLGEDEFGLLLPATEARAAVALAERILAAMRATVVPVGPAGFPLRVSIGIAGLDTARLARGFERKAVADQWLAAAHAAMHDAKRAGGDGYALIGADAPSAAGK